MSIAEICHHLCPAATPDERQISHDGHDTNLIRATYSRPTHAFTIARTARKPPHKMAMSYHPLGVSRMPDQSQLAHKTMILVNLGHRVSRFLAVVNASEAIESGQSRTHRIRKAQMSGPASKHISEEGIEPSILSV